ncbi:hydroxysteroid dehydrogenase protein 2-like [Tropilaelaps mercedesae]|uniref:Hydroxysteroid dehydrogenase protein 2-like n=1 Tax=Tropilaelaps mercedesae TaxID=418985 RepID=A0A1V9X3C7_9ACAR|nr:hydroxysteroid dehydrogenase protein 2-like [Tropilaelaps mercedesae]
MPVLQFKNQNIAVNTLWPKTSIYTAATAMLAGDPEVAQANSRRPTIMADAAYAILNKPQSFTGNFCIDEEILRGEGVTDFDQYLYKKGVEPMLDFFLPEKYYDGSATLFSTGGATAGASDPTKGSGLDKLFNKVKTLLTDELVQNTKGLFVFQVKEGGEYYIDLKNGSGGAGKGSPSGKADVTFVANEQTLVEMFKGDLKPIAAFMSGKLKLKGDMGKAMKLEKLMKEAQGKL